MSMAGCCCLLKPVSAPFLFVSGLIESLVEITHLSCHLAVKPFFGFPVKLSVRILYSILNNSTEIVKCVLCRSWSFISISAIGFFSTRSILFNIEIYIFYVKPLNSSLAEGNVSDEYLLKLFFSNPPALRHLQYCTILTQSSSSSSPGDTSAKFTARL